MKYKEIVMKKVVKIILKFTPILFAFVGILCFPVCNGFLELSNGNMTYMACHYMMKMGMLMTIVILVLTIEEFIIKRNLMILHIVTGLLLILITFKTQVFDGPCNNAVMACHKTAWVLRIAGILFFITGFIHCNEKCDNETGNL